MKLASILIEVLQLTPKLQDSFDNIYARIRSSLKDEAGVQITPKWIAGFLNQIHKFPDLNYILDNAQASGNDALVKDTTARIKARDTMARMGLLDPQNKFQPTNEELFSRMRQYYAQEPNEQKQQADMGKVTRTAIEAEYGDWFRGLTGQQKQWVTAMQELTPEEWANFKGVVAKKEDKKKFVDHLAHFGAQNDAATKALTDMGVLRDNQLVPDVIEGLREFLGSVSNSRLQDIISKSMKYQGKKSQHDDYRNTANAALKQMDQNPNSSYNTMINLYNFIAPKIMQQKDKERAFRHVLARAITKVPAAHGNNDSISQGVMHLWKTFQGQHIDPQKAIQELRDRDRPYGEPSERIRSKKARTRMDTIRRQTDL
jgi:hypothetical protein